MGRKVKEGIDFLSRVRSGALQGVWHRNGIGDIDLVWGNDGGGLCHILKKHINDKDFKNKADFVNRLNDIINNGNVDFDYFVELDSWITTNLTSDYKASERDYSGLSEMTNGRMADGRVKNGYDEDQILANVMDTEDMLGKDIVKDLWDKTKACCITTKSHDLSDEPKKLPANNYGQSRCKYLTNILGGFIISYCRQNGLMISMHCSPHAK